MGTPRNIVHVSTADISAGRVNHITTSDQQNIASVYKVLGISTSASPTVSLGTGAGTGASGSVTGSNTSFQLSVTAGTSAAHPGTLATVTFGEALPMTTPHCVISPANVNAAELSGSANVWANSTSNTAVFTTGTGSALSNGSTYVWNCLIM